MEAMGVVNGGALHTHYHDNNASRDAFSDGARGEQSIAPKLPRIRSMVCKEALVVTVLFIWAFFLRFPFFFPATLDWDESTFIIVGQGILDGLLPYDALWETKPPLVYVFFAAAISLFGKTIVAIRFAGCLWITVAAYLTYRAAYSVTSEKRASIAASALFISATSLFSSEVMAESLALVPIIGVLLLLLTTERTAATCLFAGVLMGAAGMFRTNLAYLAALIGIYIVLCPPIISIPRLAVRGLLYAAGGMIVVFITAIPYLMQDRLELWFNSVFLAPLIHSSATRSFANVQALALKAFSLYPDFPFFNRRIFLIGSVLWIGGFLGVVLCFRRWRDLSHRARDQAVILLIFLIGSVASVFLTGAAHSHYLIQLIPSFAIFSAIALTSQPVGKRRLVVGLTAFLLIVLYSVRFVSHEYSSLAQRVKNNKSLSFGPEYEIAQYLQHENPDRKPVFLLSDHIVYWFIGQYPVTRLSTHPSNITKQFLIRAVEGPNATPESEMRRILSRTPAFIVKEKYLWYFDYFKAEEARMLLNNTLNRDYVLTNVIDAREIYRRK